MSCQLGRIVSEILHKNFGEIIQKVGNDLFTYGSKPIALLTKTTGLSRLQVIDSLRTLLKFDLASFEPSINEFLADYTLKAENVLLMIRYPRYLLQIKTKYGSEAELLVEEILQQGSCTSTKLFITITTKYKDDKEKNITILKLKDTFISLATAEYIQQAPVADLKESSDIPVLVPVATIVPDIDIRPLVQAMSSGNFAEITDNVYWKVNYDRFHQDFRDDLMIKAMTRRIDENAGELMRHLLLQMALTSSAWAAESNPIHALDLRESCRRVATERPLLHQHFDQYLKVLEESGCGFVVRGGEAGGGQLAVRARAAARQLALAVITHAVAERLGHNAARIFRLIYSKKYIEEEDIQKYAMLPNKECKQLTYKLLEEHFISVQPMRKAASAGAMAKAVYLYHIKFNDVCAACEQCVVRALYNGSARARAERAQHARLLDKRRRVRAIVHGMRLRNEPHQHIHDVEETITPPEHMLLQNIEKRLKQLKAAELELDRSLFILQWYFMYTR